MTLLAMTFRTSVSPHRRCRGRGWDIGKKKGRAEEKEQGIALFLLPLFLFFPNFPNPLIRLLRRPALCSGGQGFNSCRGLRLILCSKLVSYIHTYNHYLYTIKMSNLSSLRGRVLIRYKKKKKNTFNW